MEPKFLMLDDRWSSYPYVLFNLDESSDLIPSEWVSDYKSNWNENCDAGEEINFDTAKKQMTENFIDSLTTVDGFCEKNKILWVNNEFYKYFDSGNVKFLGLFSNLNECLELE